ncbi:MAG TPA: cadherin-like domain-containing protein [Planctomycetota bacterium]|nr:cadherin-like domain-containing protein [Planctomycetota bacterium]
MSRRHLRPLCLIALIAASSYAADPMIAVGEAHTVYLADDGTVWCWGDNSQGQLGDGTNTPQLTAKRVSDAAIVDIVAVAAGSYNTFALRADGVLYSWGRNTDGSLGRSSAVAQLATPGPVDGLTGVRIKAVAAGEKHGLALSVEGKVYAWGADDVGQIGDGGTADISYWAKDISLSTIKAVAAGGNHSLVLTAAGKLKAWGAGGEGQIGDAGFANRTLPTSVNMPVGDFAIAIACGSKHNVAIYANGTGHTWGWNADGQCGNGTQVNIGAPSASNIFGQCRAVSAGSRHTLSLRLDGLVVVTGDNSAGQIRLGSGTQRVLSPTAIGVNDARALASGPMAMHTMLLRRNGLLTGFGTAASGQLGNGGTGYSSGTDVTAYANWPVSKMTAVALGQNHANGLKSDGTVWGWGSASVGQVGDGGTGSRSAPVLLTGVGSVCALATGSDYGDFTVALRSDGTVYAWGANDDEELGNASVASLPTPNPFSASPVLVAGTSGVTSACRAIGAGDHHALAVKQDGSVIAWGSDGEGQLGNGATTTLDQESPVAVTGLTNIIAVAGGGGYAGAGFSLALRADGNVYAWGRAAAGELGNGSTTGSAVPVQVSTINNIIAIAAGSYHAVALRSDGTVWCWGSNSYGALGNGTLGNALTPVQVKTSATAMLGGMRSLSGGSYHTVAVSGDGGVWTWGSNISGALGDSGGDRLFAAPISVPGRVSTVDAGYANNLVTLADGSIRGWGNNGNSQLGTPTGTSATPVTTDPTWLPQVTLGVLDASASETGPENGSFTVSRDLTRSQIGSLTVDLAYAGAAVDAIDYTRSPSGQIILPPNFQTATVFITPIDDDDDEDIDFEDVVPYVVDHPADYQSSFTGLVITIQDDDFAEVMVSTISPSTFESDDDVDDDSADVARTFKVWLASRPTAPVDLYFYSSNFGEGRVDTDPTPGNQDGYIVSFMPDEHGFDNFKVIEVFGQQDDFDDGDIPYDIVHYATVSGDPKYAGRVAPQVGFINIDDDAAGINVAGSMPAVSEATGASHTQTFLISLTSEPYFPVYFAISSSDPGEGYVHPDDSTIVLHAGNWSSGQTVRIVGENDWIDDGDVDFTINVDRSSSDDGAYDGQGAWSVAARCTDDDARGVIITPSASRLVAEGGVTAAYSVKLASEPVGGSVTITANADAQSRVGPTPALIGASYALTFTDRNWDDVQFLIVAAIDDATTEATPHDADITHSAVGGDYTGVPIAGVDLDISDNDSAGFIFTPQSAPTPPSARLITSETGASVTYMVRPTTELTTGTVTVLMRSNDVSEGRLTTPVVLTTTSVAGMVIQLPALTDLSTVMPYEPVYFTSAGLNSGQIRYVDSVDDDADTITVDAVLTNETSAETIEVHPLLSRVFDSTNWSTGLPVTVTGRSDALTDGAVYFTVDGGIDESSPTRDTSYDGLGLDTVYLTNLDASGGGVVVTQVGATEVDEAVPGTTDTFSVNLTSAPANPVTIAISAGTQVGVSHTQLFFTAADFSTPQVVTVSAIDDAVDEASPHTGTITFTSSSSDLTYNGLTIPPVAVSVADNDAAGIAVLPTSGLVTSENLSSASFFVVLSSQPMTPVVLGVSSSLLTEGTVSPATLTFTAANWYQPRAVTVTGVNDLVDDNDVGYRIQLTADSAPGTDPNYRDRDPLDVDVINQDNDTVGVTLTPISGAIDEDGAPAASATYTLRLNTKPSAITTINVNAGTQLRVGSSATEVLTFDPTENDPAVNAWNRVRTITVTAVNDVVAEGPHSGTITHTASGGGYGAVAIPDIAVSIIEDGDTAGFAVSAAAVATTEPATGGSFTVALTSRPSGNVTVAVASGAPTQGTVSPSTLTFTPALYNTVQTVTVTPVDDDRVEAPAVWSVTLSAFSGDSGYNGLTGTKSVTANDNDVADIIATAVGGPTTEAGGSRVFSVRLNSQPSAAVAIGLASTDLTEGTVLPPALGFAPANWNVPQLVTVTGVDDDVDDGDIAYNASAADAAVTSADATYNQPAGFGFDVAVTNSDDDTAGIRVTPTAGLVTSESGATASFTVVLDSEPTTDVVIATIVSSAAAEGTAAPSSLTFTAANWDTPQTVTVTGKPDAIDDGDVVYSIQTSVATSGDGNYNNRVVADVAVTNSDDDIPGVTIAESAGTAVHERLVAPLTDSYTVRLDTQPGVGQTVTVTASHAGGQVRVDGATSRMLSFDSTTWSTPQTITVTAVSDGLDESDPHTATITHAVGNYGSVSTAASVTVSIDDDDAPTMVANAGLPVLRGQIGVVITSAVLAATDAENPAPAMLTYVVQLAPGQGILRRAGTELIAGMTFTQAQVDAGLITYDHGGSVATTDGFAFRVRDDASNLGGIELFSFTVDVDVPVVTLTAGSIAFAEAALPTDPVPAPVLIDVSASVSDGDSTHFDNGSVTVSLPVGGDAADELSIAHQGLGASQIGYAGGVVSYGGVAIGTATGGSGGTDLLINLDSAIAADVDDSAVTALLRRLTYRNTGRNPVATKTVRIVMRDDTNLASADAERAIAVTRVNDAPVMTSGVVLTPAGIAYSGAITVSDAEGDDPVLHVFAPAGKGNVTGISATAPGTAVATTPTTSGSRAFTYTPTPDEFGSDLFVVQADDGNAGGVTQLAVNVVIAGGGAARPWIVSDPPLEIDDDGSLSYTIALSLDDYGATPPTSLTYSLVGDVSDITALFGDGVTSASVLTDSAPLGTVTLTISENTVVGGYIRLGILVTDTASNTVGYQPLLISVVPAGGGGG